MSDVNKAGLFGSLKVRIWIVIGALILTAGSQIALTYQAVSALRGISSSTSQYGSGSYLAQRLLYVAKTGLEGETTAIAQGASKAEIFRLFAQIEQRFERLKFGDEAINLPATSDPIVLTHLEKAERQWQDVTRPLYENVLAEPDFVSRQNMLERLEVETDEFIEHVQSTLQIYNEISKNRVTYANNLQLVFMFLYLAVAMFVVWETRSLFATVGEAVSSLGSGASEILASTAQQSAGAKEQAAAITQTSSTVEELLQSANQTADKAKGVASSAEHASDIGERGKEAIDAGVGSMRLVKEQSERMAEKIMGMAEQAQAIGEIVSAVSEVAEQTNILAINAGIEASRAGEQGSGFGVVAREIKELAYESRRSMTEIKKILTSIQAATNSAVLGVEEASNGIEHSITTVDHAGNVIDELVEAISANVQAAVQIAAASGQQVNAISQIQQAMQDVNQATLQTVSASRQNEQVAKSLADLGRRLKALITG